MHRSQTAVLCAIDDHSESSNRRLIKRRHAIERDSGPFVYLQRNGYRLERIATQLEVVVVQSKRIEQEHVSPDLDDYLFCGGARNRSAAPHIHGVHAR